MPPMVAGVAIYENKSSGHLQLEAIFNGLAIHSPPSAISFISNGLLGSKSCKFWIFLFSVFLMMIKCTIFSVNSSYN